MTPDPTAPGVPTPGGPGPGDPALGDPALGDPALGDPALGDPAPGDPAPGDLVLGDLVLAIDHVGIAVPDLDAAIEFYTSVFGLELRHREENAEQGVTEAMLAPPSAPPGATQLQLLAPLTADSAIARFLDRSGPGLQQLAYRVDNVDHAASVLRGKGMRLLYDAAKRGTNESMINFVHPKDTGGVLVELVQAATSVDDD